MRTAKTSLLRKLREFAEDTTGATAIEYALIATLIGVAIIVGANALGGSIEKLFCNTAYNVEHETTVGTKHCIK